MEETTAIKVENLSKCFRIPHEKHTSLKSVALNLFKGRKYTELKALEDVSFEVKKGEFFGIIGRNGSGKSTLLKVLAGIYVPDKGKITIDGKLSPFLELGVGFNPELTGRENIYLGGVILGLTRAQIDEKFDRIVAFAELHEFIDMKLKNYSSGMQVRLAFSLAINAHAEILLMDEVLAVGDSNFQTKCVREFNEYREKGKTVVLVTHDILTVQRYCDRALLLRNGKILKIGRADEVVTEYTLKNMSDEDELPATTDLLVSESNQHKKAEVIGVQLLDKNGQSKNSFQTGEPLDIKVSFKIRDVNVVNVGIGLHSAFGEVIFGYNTQIDKFDIKNNGEVILHINNVPLLKGDYYINLTLFGEIVEDIYDLRPKIKTLRIFSTGPEASYGGLFSLKHKWLLNEEK